VKNQALLYNSTTDTQVGDTYDIDGHVFEVVEDFGDGQYRLNDGRHDMPFTRDQLAKCDRVAAL